MVGGWRALCIDPLPEEDQMTRLMCIGVVLAISTSAWGQNQGQSLFKPIKRAFETARIKAGNTWILNGGGNPAAYKQHLTVHKMNALNKLTKRTKNPQDKKRLARFAKRMQTRHGSQMRRAAEPRATGGGEPTTFFGMMSSMFNTGMRTYSENLKTRGRIIDRAMDDATRLSINAGTIAESMIVPGMNLKQVKAQ
jgi:hypothetical protein